jgi:hypothetical protein
MIIRIKQQILLHQTIACKNTQLEFVDFTDNLVETAQVKNEDCNKII